MVDGSIQITNLDENCLIYNRCSILLSMSRGPLRKSPKTNPCEFKTNNIILMGEFDMASKTPEKAKSLRG